MGCGQLLKNFKPGYKKSTTTDELLSPPSKRVKVCDADEPDISKKEYQEAIKELQGNQYFDKIHRLIFLYFANIGKVKKGANTVM